MINDVYVNHLNSRTVSSRDLYILSTIQKTNVKKTSRI